MEIVIKMSDERFRDIQRIAEVQTEGKHFKTAEQIIANGTPLPERHGDLKDMGNLKYMFDLTREDFIYSGKDIERTVKAMTTIIPADTENGGRGMTIDEAIKHCEEVTESHNRIAQIKAVTLEECKCAEEHRQLAAWLRELKQLREQTRWTPISEKLPEQGHTNYLVTVDYGASYKRTSCQRFFYNKELGWDDDSIIAWMPLPAPFKSQESDDENCDDILESIYAERDGKKMNGSFELALNNPLTKEDWDKIMDVELENTPSVTFKTPKGKEVKYIKADILDKIRKEIEEKEFSLNCTEVSDVTSKTAYIEALKIVDKYKTESED